MNYYPKHIGDYARDTAHLSMVEDGAYNRLLDLAYATEKPLPLDRDRLYRLARATTESEKRAIDIVLGEFFVEGDGGWYHKRVREEIRKAQAKIKAAKTNGKRGGRPKTHRDSKDKPTGLADRNPSESSQSQSQSQEKREAPQRSRGSRLPADWAPSADLLACARAERADLDLDATLARFRDHWAAAAGSKGVKLDWNATYRNWIRNEKQAAAPRAPAPAVASTVQLGNCPCGALATLKVGGKPRCNAHIGGFEAVA